MTEIVFAGKIENFEWALRRWVGVDGKSLIITLPNNPKSGTTYLLRLYEKTLKKYHNLKFENRIHQLMDNSLKYTVSYDPIQRTMLSPDDIYAMWDDVPKHVCEWLGRWFGDVGISVRVDDYHLHFHPGDFDFEEEEEEEDEEEEDEEEEDEEEEEEELYIHFTPLWV